MTTSKHYSPSSVSSVPPSHSTPRCPRPRSAPTSWPAQHAASRTSSSSRTPRPTSTSGWSTTGCGYAVDTAPRRSTSTFSSSARSAGCPTGSSTTRSRAGGGSSGLPSRIRQRCCCIRPRPHSPPSPRTPRPGRRRCSLRRRAHRGAHGSRARPPAPRRGRDPRVDRAPPPYHQEVPQGGRHARPRPRHPAGPRAVRGRP